MSSSQKEFEEQLKEAGNTLLNPPSAIDELLKLLDEVEDLLTNVEQAPPRSMQDALLPLMKALICNELLRHSDMDVKVSVASCITEITRITAPEPPYDDERMKEIFQLTVAAFEKLSHVPSRCYKKAVSMLENVEKVRSSLVMLDLQCDALILEMFEHFLKAIQSNHPDTVFSAMEAIMTVVLNESEEIPLDLLKTLLSSVRKENQSVSPICWKLGEKVIDNCSATLKPYLIKAVKSMDISLGDYDQIVSSVCLSASDALKCDHVNDCEKNLVTEGLAPDAVFPGEVNKTVAAPTRDGFNVIPENPSKKLQPCHLTKHSKDIDSRDNAQPDNSFSLKTVKSEIEPDSAPKKRGRKPNSSMNPDNKSDIEPNSAPRKRGWKPNSLMNPEEGYEHSWMHSGRKTSKSSGKRKFHDKTLPTEESLRGEDAFPMTHQRVNEILSSQPKNEGDVALKASGSRKSQEKGVNTLASEHPLPRKATLPVTLLKGPEPPTLERKNEKDIGASSPFLQNNLDGTRPKRGRPKKKVVKEPQEANPSSLSVERVDFASAQVEEKSPQSADINLKKESEETITLTAKARGRPRDIGLGAKTNEETILASVHVVAEKESAVPCDPEEKPEQQSALELGTGNTNDQSSVQRDIKKHRGDATSGKDGTAASGRKKISRSETKLEGDKNFIEGTPKKVLKRKRTIGKEEASQMPDPDERLVGRRIKVWWPMDKAFYEGVVYSYNASKKKHLVLYADGDEENLNLRKQRWQLIGDDILPVGQNNDLPNPDSSSDRPQKRRRKTKSESSKQSNAGLSSKRISRSGVSACISIVMKSGSKSTDHSTLDEPTVDAEPKDDQPKENDRLKDDGQISAGEVKVDMKTGIDSTQITPETVTLSTEGSPKVDIEPSGEECAKELIELSKGAKNARSFPTPELDKAV